MPVFLPDPDLHKLCRRCRKWFEPDEGVLSLPEATGPISRLRQTAAIISGDERALRFICHRCAAVRRRTQIVLFRPWSSWSREFCFSTGCA